MENKSSQFKYAVPLALVFGFLFFWLQKSGFLSSFSFGNISYGTAFVIGIVASLSTCMAVVGGLVLSMSTTFAKSGDRFRPQLLFHVARIVSFFLLGGIIGMIGKAFTLSISATVVLNTIIALVMLTLGLNLLDIRFARRLQFAMPRAIGRHALNIFDLEHGLAPLLAGVATFFLPCGFTQAMQVYTLKSGSFIAGGLTMLFFALGTLPMLALVSFSPAVFKNEEKKGIFFKTAGLIVLLFASLNLYSALVLIGILPPVLNF